MNVSVILSGGVGVRFGNERPKQYHTLLGKEVIAHSIDAVKQSTLTDKIIVVAGINDVERLKMAYGVDCIFAGETHNDSVANALDYIHINFTVCGKVFFIDAARPFITADIVDNYYNFLDKYDGVITAQRITDSLGSEGKMLIDRSIYFLIQKPEAFRFVQLYDYFSRESPATAIVQQMPPNSRIMKCFDVRQNLKITYPEDLLFAEYIMTPLRLENGR